MPNANLLKSRLRDSTGLVVTIALHAGVAAIALLAVTFAAPERPLPPLITRPIPDPVVSPPAPPELRPIDLPVRIDPTPPDYVIDSPPTAPDPIVPAPTAGDGPMTGTVAGTGTAAPADPPVLPIGETRIARLDPRYADRAQPPYPSAARRAGEAGNVVVHVRIGRDGRVIAASLARSSGSARLDAAALAHALANWRFTPALADGVAVEAERDITVTFRLDAPA